MEITTDNITADDKFIAESEWKVLMRSHEHKLAGILDPYLKKRSMQQKDPVLDFLFEYYAFRPSHLKRWSPGIGVSLGLSEHSDLPEVSELSVSDQTAFLDPNLFPTKRLKSLRWTLQLLKNSSNKKPLFGCFGMHEWAMVYRAGEVRHEQIPLRLSDDEIAEFVESRPLLCTHFDAFRFFTEKAKPMNRNELNRDNFEDMEQPGCLHTNMDLYKWAYKFYPWISSEILRKTFFNAVETRKIDMQASPYDALEFGLQPIKIETEEGRKDYLDKQTKIFERSMPIRQDLIEAMEDLLVRVE
ncbi:3-methyladenine DNA glycosylase [Rhodohalobacter barkolensis]|uniref:3-methyladenine DNA glycosylase n=1 Tax=Rhodohalobacter barkolensis TaxID=2053187 RepID=A0A2N0VF28_9BACT|nr:3-methyladenine DNA glycosylase [Rhodohalobacter barkolensis]PKD42801.1 3-methyladenine DNA glycosylase [Rhodohalobacter barkolensis]